MGPLVFAILNEVGCNFSKMFDFWWPVALDHQNITN